MERLERTIDVDVPVRVAYAQWARFEDFPRFMDGVKEVRRLDGTHLHWRAAIAGKDEEWDAEVTRDVPGELLAWRSTSGAPNGGEVRFEPLGADRTRVHVAMEYEPQSWLERAGDAMGFVGRQVERTVHDFKRHVETGAEGIPGIDYGIPLVGKLVSPGAPGSGINGTAGKDVFPEPPRERR